MPLNDLLTVGRNEQLLEMMDAEPQWSRFASMGTSIGVVLVAVVTFVGAASEVDRPILLALLLTAATAPFVVVCFVHKLDHTVVEIVSLAALALLNLFGSPLGVTAASGHDQTSLLIAVWLTGETASIGRRRDVIFVTAVGLAMTLGRSLVDPAYTAGVIWSIGIGIAFVAGLFIRSLVVALVNTKIAEAALREQATTAERQRIAREVHDVIAHSMTVTMLHLTAARMAVARGDSAAATEALEEAEKAGRTSLNEIRHTVGLLRTDDTQPQTTALPTGTDLPDLVDNYRAAGIAAELHVRGDLTNLDAAAGLALYRIVQESLTNVGRHAPGAHTVVRVDVGPPLTVDVASDGGSMTDESGTGLGLAGMAERAAALGGSLEAGRHGDGWRVAAVIP